MKRKLSYLALILIVPFLTLVSCTPKSNIKIFPEITDLDTISDNETGYPIVKIYNPSSKPIELDTILTSTNSIRPINIPKSFAPKDTTLIEFSVRTEFLRGDFNTLVQFKIKDQEEPIETFIKGFVRATPENIEDLCTLPFCNMLVNKRLINFGTVKIGETVRDTVKIFNPTRRTQFIYYMGMSPNVKSYSVDRSLRNGKSTDIVIEYTPTDIDRLGFTSEMLPYDVGDIRCKESLIVIEANVVESFDHLTEKELAMSADVEIDNADYDFGDLKEGKVYSHDFKVTNKGQTPLVIREVRTTCGCTIAKLSKKVIAPGETINIEALFDTKNRIGKQQKSIVLVTNSPKAQFIKLWITANVIK